MEAARNRQRAAGAPATTPASARHPAAPHGAPALPPRAAPPAANPVAAAGRWLSDRAHDLDRTVHGATTWLANTDSHAVHAAGDLARQAARTVVQPLQALPQTRGLAQGLVRTADNVVNTAVHTGDATFQAGRGLLDGAAGIVSGTVGLVGGGLQVAADPHVRAQTVHTLDTVRRDPVGVARGVVDAGVHAFQENPAYALGNVASNFIPVGAAAGALSKAGRLGRVADGAADVARLAEAGTTVATTGRAVRGAAARTLDAAGDVARALPETAPVARAAAADAGATARPLQAAADAVPAARTAASLPLVPGVTRELSELAANGLTRPGATAGLDRALRQLEPRTWALSEATGLTEAQRLAGGKYLMDGVPAVANNLLRGDIPAATSDGLAWMFLGQNRGEWTQYFKDLHAFSTSVEMTQSKAVFSATAREFKPGDEIGAFLSMTENPSFAGKYVPHPTEQRRVVTFMLEGSPDAPARAGIVKVPDGWNEVLLPPNAYTVGKVEQTAFGEVVTLRPKAGSVEDARNAFGAIMDARVPETVEF